MAELVINVVQRADEQLFRRATRRIVAWGVSDFFWAYMLLEVSSNLVLARVGARKWIARIMISWKNRLHADGVRDNRFFVALSRPLTALHPAGATTGTPLQTSTS